MSLHSSNAKIVLIANVKGGSGKSTLSMNLATFLVSLNYRVLCIDTDGPQYTLHKYISNRINTELYMHCIKANTTAEVTDILQTEHANYDFILIDTSGNLSEFNKSLHKLCDLLITPLNDSMIDLNLIMYQENKSMKLGSYGEFIFQLKIEASMQNKPFYWFVVRNRLSPLANLNTLKVTNVLQYASKSLGFQILQGITERVIYKNGFDTGRTVFDIDDNQLNKSALSARSEIRSIASEILRILD